MYFLKIKQTALVEINLYCLLIDKHIRPRIQKTISKISNKIIFLLDNQFCPLN